MMRIYRCLDIPQYREGWDKIIIKRTRQENKTYDIIDYVDFLHNVKDPARSSTLGSYIKRITKAMVDKYSLKYAHDTYKLNALTELAFFSNVGKDIAKKYVMEKDSNGDDLVHYEYPRLFTY